VLDCDLPIELVKRLARKKYFCNVIGVLDVQDDIAKRIIVKSAGVGFQSL
jgi:hypothetical protein